MFHTILVPLDGSARAERAIPVAAQLVRATGGTLILLHVASFRVEYGPYLAHTPLYTVETELAYAKDYLDHVVERHTMTDIQVCKEALPGIAAQTILAIVERRHVDLLVLCSHGYTGIKRWALGSVAQKIARQSPVPVLVLREHSQKLMETSVDTARPVRAVVAVDGSPFAQAALAPAAYLVAALTPPQTQGRLHLTHVLKTLTPQEERVYQQWGLDVDLQAEALQTMRTALQTVADETTNTLGAQLNIQITWSVEESEDVAEALLNIAELREEGEAFDLIVLATHGRGGFQRWMMGSVTEHVLEGSKLPLLIVRPQEPRTTAAQRERVEEEARSL